MAAHALLYHHRSDYGEWESFEREPLPALRPYVKRITGWVEWTAFTRRREVANPGAVLILNIDNRIRVSQPGSPGLVEPYHVFFGGMNSAYVVTETDRFGGGVQLDLTPIGAHLLAGVPANEFTNRVIHAEDIFGREVAALVERLEATADWDARLDFVEAFALRRFRMARQPGEGVAWAWAELERAHGNVRIDSLGAMLGLTPRQLIAEFRREVGLPPKQAARILRFQRAISLLGAPEPCLAEIAFQCGYYDQAHFTRDFREFAGCTPTQHLRRLIPETGGVLDDDEFARPVS